MAIALRVPATPQERRQIGQLAAALATEIRLLESLRRELDRQRRAVAEILLTGKVRVPA